MLKLLSEVGVSRNSKKRGSSLFSVQAGIGFRGSLGLAPPSPSHLWLGEATLL